MRFSITVKLYKGLQKVIAAIAEEAWKPIPYWIGGGADVAETTYRTVLEKAPRGVPHHPAGQAHPG